MNCKSGQHHVTFFKDLMGQCDIARDFLMKQFPSDLVTKVNWDTLEPESVEQNTNNQDLLCNDCLFSAKFNDLPGKLYLCLLLEYLSYPNENTIPLKVMHYRLEVMDMHLKQYPNSPLPLIYPFIIYQNPKPYQGSRSLIEMYPENLQPYARWMWMEPLGLIEDTQESDEGTKSSMEPKTTKDQQGSKQQLY